MQLGNMVQVSNTVCTQLWMDVYWLAERLILDRRLVCLMIKDCPQIAGIYSRISLCLCHRRVILCDFLTALYSTVCQCYWPHASRLII